ncbi:hypothetical protein [Capnocytophaga granulosa]|uniref:hypothetical protein n=1 Tax=Capnocytophaga granulosa TaxID=45242 RepID=UPI002052D7FF|nr:hypothetical protein [Capnocytophaga granulosa]DAY22106.1 MAG TPA: hypothetical protein [Caudoviricetes sp.]
MKTVFKKGMKVYDSVFFPKSEGKVVDIDKQIDCERVIVRFDCLDYKLSYTEQGRLTSTRNEAAPTLSTSPYTFQGFEQKAPAPTYEEAVNWIENNKRYNPAYVEIDEKEKVFLSKTYFYAFEALRKLIILRDYYNEGWQPNWKKEREIKYVIYNDSNKLATIQSYTFSYVLAFKEGNIRNKFLEEQRELLENAKPLL